MNSWSRPAETGAPLEVLENRFPTLFETRRMFYPSLEAMADPARFNQGIAGVMDNIVRQNFSEFVHQASVDTGHPVLELERVQDDGTMVTLDDAMLREVDTLIIIGYDSLRSRQEATDAELGVVRNFLAKPGNLLCVCPHHDIGYIDSHGNAAILQQQTVEVIACQRIDRNAPPHPFTEQGRFTFDACLQSRIGLFAGDLVVCDATLWSSTAGGTESLRRLWSNVARRKIDALTSTFLHV